jgi:small subunit ribosomal protein S12
VGSNPIIQESCNAYLMLGKFPQRKSICLKVLTMSPKKPNSANRRVLKVKLTSCSVALTVKIRGEGHTLQQHSSALIHNAMIKDLIGVSSVAVRGKYDLSGVSNRRSSRSLYGVKIKAV